MPKYVFISGPYTIGDMAQNVRDAILAADTLAIAGFIPFIPHLNHFWHFLCPHDIYFWYQYDFAWLEKCDCLVRLAGESPGADREVIQAQKLGIPVYFSVAECVGLAFA